MLTNIADKYLSNFQPKVKTPASSYLLGKGILGKKEAFRERLGKSSKEGLTLQLCL